MQKFYNRVHYLQSHDRCVSRRFSFAGLTVINLREYMKIFHVVISFFDKCVTEFLDIVKTETNFLTFTIVIII